MSVPRSSENRFDPDCKRGLDFHVPRALTRFAGLHDRFPREAIPSARFREGDVMRDRLLEYLDRLDGSFGVESQELLDVLAVQYDVNFSNWKSVFELSSNDLATLAKKDDVLEWTSTLPAETISVLRQHGGPRLKLLPDMSIEGLMEVMNRHKTIPDQRDGNICSRQWKNVIAPAGSFGLTTDLQNIPFDSSILLDNWVRDSRGVLTNSRRNNVEMIFEYKRRFEQTPGATIMPQFAYLPSVMDAMARGLVYDQRGRLGFEPHEGSDRVPYACGWADRVNLDDLWFGNSNVGLCARIWVSGRKV